MRITSKDHITLALIQAAFTRAFRTFAQAALAIIGVGAIGIIGINWIAVLSGAGLAFIISLLQSVAGGLPECKAPPPDIPSNVTNVTNIYRSNPADNVSNAPVHSADAPKSKPQTAAQDPVSSVKPAAKPDKVVAKRAVKSASKSPVKKKV